MSSIERSKKRQSRGIEANSCSATLAIATSSSAAGLPGPTEYAAKDFFGPVSVFPNNPKQETECKSASSRPMYSFGSLRQLRSWSHRVHRRDHNAETSE